MPLLYTTLRELLYSIVYALRVKIGVIPVTSRIVMDSASPDHLRPKDPLERSCTQSTRIHATRIAALLVGIATIIFMLEAGGGFKVIHGFISINLGNATESSADSNSGAADHIISGVRFPASVGLELSLPVPLWNFTAALPLWLTSVNWTDFPPLSMAKLERSFTPPMSPEAWCPWIRVAKALDMGAHIDIAVLGGSMTAGGQCDYVKCPWTTYLQDWFARARPRWNITITNLANSGMGSHEWVHQSHPLLDRLPDVILIDTSVSLTDNLLEQTRACRYTTCASGARHHELCLAFRFRSNCRSTDSFTSSLH
jgi:hypothetical protein